MNKLIPNTLLGVAGLTALGVIAMQSPALGDGAEQKAKREDDAATLVLVADDVDDDDADDGVDDVDTSGPTTAGDSTRGRHTRTRGDHSRGDHSRADHTRDTTRDGGATHRDHTADSTNDGTRHNTRG